jgi:hypothetical protein
VNQTGALVLNLSGAISGAHAPQRICVAKIALDKAFDLIEGHPPPDAHANVACHALSMALG